MTQKHRYAFIALFLLLCIRFFLPLWQYHIPLGYDPGIYRYLFLAHAEGLPPFIVSDIQPWATSHPLGLFMLTSPLLKLGMPVDWLLGWMWNAVPVAVLCVFAYIVSRKWGVALGLCLLIVGLLSQPYYDGFSGMYWKAFVSMAWMIVAFHLIERHSLWAIVPSIMSLVTHNQTGLLFAITAGVWWLIEARKSWDDPRLKYAVLAGIGVCVIAVGIYLPVWKQSVIAHLVPMLTQRGDNVPAGSFPTAAFYLKTQCFIFAIGVLGWVQSYRDTKEVTSWHIAALVCAVFVFARLYFYRRFFLQLDFFLLPFAAYGLRYLWLKIPGSFAKLVLIVGILVQAHFSYDVMQLRKPELDRRTFEFVQQLSTVIPPDAHIITMENKTATWMVGWLPGRRVAGPGLFWLNWTYEDWEHLLFGTDEQRSTLFASLPKNTYFVDTPIFHQYYEDHAEAFFNDPCIHRIEGTPLLELSCP